MSAHYHEVEQRSDEWLALKVATISGTRLKNVCKSNNLTLIDELISESMTGRIEQIYVNEAMQRGVDLEPVGIKEYENEFNRTVHEIGFVTNDKWPGCGLSPDGYVGSNGAIELKCPSSKKHIEYIRTNKLPAEYKYQVAMYFLMDEGVDWVDFVSFDPRVKLKPLHVLTISRADLELDQIEIELRKFCEKWAKYYDQITF